MSQAHVVRHTTAKFILSLLLSISFAFIAGGLCQFALGLFLLRESGRPPYAHVTLRATLPSVAVGSALVGTACTLLGFLAMFMLDAPLAHMRVRYYLAPILLSAVASVFVGAVGVGVAPPQGAAEAGFGVVHALVVSGAGLAACAVVVVVNVVQSLMWFV